MKRIISILIAFALSVGACFALSACGLTDLTNARIVEISTEQQLRDYVRDGFPTSVETGSFLGSALYATVEKYVLTADIEFTDPNAWTNDSMKDWSDPTNTGDHEAKLKDTGGAQSFVLDGNGHSLKGLTIDGDGFSSLFGKAENCTVKNLVIDGFTVKGKYHVGALFGRTSGTLTLDNVTLKNSTIGADGAFFVGGLVGSAENATLKVTNCKVENTTVGGSEAERVGGIIGSTVDMTVLELTGTATAGKVEAVKYGGGIIGYYEENHADRHENELNEIKGASSSMTVLAENYVGGIVGGLIFGDYNDLRVTDCSASAATEADFIRATNHGAGGIVGAVMWKGSKLRVPDGSRITFEGCSSSANPYAAMHAGGIVGWVGEYMWETHFISCTNSGAVCADENAGGIAGCVKDLILGSEKEIKFEGCVNAGSVIGKADVGGILGDTDRTKILFKSCKGEPADNTKYIQVDKRGGGIASCYGVYEDCSNATKIIVNTVDASDCGTVGGIVGEAHTASSFKNCANSGNILVNGNGSVRFVGGIAGVDSAPKYTNCSNSGKIYGTDSIGGIVGNLIRSVGDFTMDGISSTGDIYALGTASATADRYNSRTVVGGIGGIFGSVDKPASGSVKLKNTTVDFTVYAVRDLDFVGGIIGRVDSINDNPVSDYFIIGEQVTVTPSLLLSHAVSSVCKTNWRTGGGAGGSTNADVNVSSFNSAFTLTQGTYTD